VQVGGVRAQGDPRLQIGHESEPTSPGSALPPRQ
jgi:hypothetical protein